MKRSLPLAAALLALPMAAWAQTNAACRDKPVPPAFEGTGYAVDGDTLALPGHPRVRLWGIQAPELRDKSTGQETNAGMQARAALEELLAADRSRTRCPPTKWDRYCRVVAVCTTGRTDLARTLIERGMGYGGWLEETVRDQPNLGTAYADAETAARRERRGLWKDWLAD